LAGAKGQEVQGGIHKVRPMTGVEQAIVADVAAAAAVFVWYNVGSVKLSQWQWEDSAAGIREAVFFGSSCLSRPQRPLCTSFMNQCD